MKALVTGCAGFIGSHLVDRLISDGHTVIGIDDLSNGKLTNLDAHRNNSSFHLCLGDVVSGSIIDGNADLNDVDWFFHLAAKADIVPSIERPMDYHKVNVTGTIKALEAARKMKVKKFVYAASSSCYGLTYNQPTPETELASPQYPYALTKYLGEQYVTHWSKLYKIPAVSLRLFNVYGPRHRTSGAYGAVFGVFMSQMANGKPITIVGDGNQSRDFTYVTDVVDAFVTSAHSKAQGIYNVGSGYPHSVNELADLLGAKDRVHIPDRPGEPKVTHADTEKIFTHMLWRAVTSFEIGVGRMKALIPEYKNAPLWTPEKIEDATKVWFESLS